MLTRQDGIACPSCAGLLIFSSVITFLRYQTQIISRRLSKQTWARRCHHRPAHRLSIQDQNFNVEREGAIY